MELIFTRVIKAEHTGALPGSPSFFLDKKKLYFHAPAPGTQVPKKGSLYLLIMPRGLDAPLKF